MQDSFVHPSDYVKKIHHYNQNPNRKYNIIALSLTDHGNMHGIVKLNKACSEPGPDGKTIKPIYGNEVYHCRQRPSTDRYHMVLLAKDEQGLQNLYRITSDAGVNRILSKAGRPFSISEEASLKRWGKGIIATSACLGGIIPKLIEEGKYDEAKQKALEYATYFDSFYLEVQPHDVPEQLLLNEAMVRMSQETGLPLVMAVDAHYVDKQDKKYHDILKDLAHHTRYNTDNYLYLPEELEEYCLAYNIPLSAMSNTVVIANQCNVNPKPKNNRGLLPEFPVPPGYTEAGYLREMVMRELFKKVSEKKILNPMTYVNRALYELDVICGAGFEGYFLILWDWFKDCREQGILMGKGRGSAAGSLCCYALDITTIDPIVNGLIFERFLSPERLEFPDVDSDVSKRDRPRAIEYLLKRYGQEHVAQIITFSEYKLKNTLKAVNTAYGFLTNDEINAITTKIPSLVNGEGVTYDLVEKIATEPEKFHDITQKEINECQRIYQELQDLFRRFPVFEEAIVHLRGAIASQGE